jgi:hypothetical protein
MKKGCQYSIHVNPSNGNRTCEVAISHGSDIYFKKYGKFPTNYPQDADMVLCTQVQAFLAGWLAREKRFRVKIKAYVNE